MNTDKLEDSKRAAKLYWKSRMDGKKSQEYMALSLGVSKNTVSNWEKGTSCPSMRQTAEWFRVLGLNPFRYYLEYYYPEAYENVSYDNVTELLHNYIDNMAINSQKELAYLFLGNHGSSVGSVLQMLTAHLHTDLRSRVGVAELIARNYELCEATDSLVCKDDVLPNMELLKNSIELGHKAVINGNTGYTIARE